MNQNENLYKLQLSSIYGNMENPNVVVDIDKSSMYDLAFEAAGTKIIETTLEPRVFGEDLFNNLVLSRKPAL